MSDLTHQVRNVQDQSFDPTNPLHIYVGRSKQIPSGTKRVKVHPHFLANPYRILPHQTREHVIRLYREWLWNKIKSQDLTTLQFLANLPNDAVLYCHCAPKSCHAEIIWRASEYVKTNHLFPPEPKRNNRTLPGSYKMPFGCHKGKDLNTIAEERISYLDWLGSCEYLWPLTRQQLNIFLDQPRIKNEINRLFWDEDFRCGRHLEHITAPAFLPSQQVAKPGKFNRGKPTWLKVDWTRDRGAHPDSNLSQETLARINDTSNDIYQPVNPGPQEPERDHTHKPLRPGEAWDLVAEWLVHLEEHTDPFDLPDEFPADRIHEACQIVPQSVAARLRSAWTSYIEWTKTLPLEPENPIDYKHNRGRQLFPSPAPSE